MTSMDVPPLPSGPTTSKYEGLQEQATRAAEYASKAIKLLADALEIYSDLDVIDRQAKSLASIQIDAINTLFEQIEEDA